MDLLFYLIVISFPSLGGDLEDSLLILEWLKTLNSLTIDLQLLRSRFKFLLLDDRKDWESHLWRRFPFYVVFS